MISADGFELYENKSSDEENATVSSETKESTNWRLIIVTGVVSCLISVENSVLGMGEWPYMKEIDKEANAQFFGFTQSASKCFHAIFALVFSIWSFKVKSIKYPMIVSRFIAIIACCIYLSVEYFKSDKKYVLMSVYVLIGVSNTLQLIFSGIAYPGIEVFPGIRFHVYSVPIWFSLVLTVITAVIIWVYMTDVHRISIDDDESGEFFSFKQLKQNYEQLKNSGLMWKLIAVCLTVKISVTFLSAILGSIMSIVFMVQYGWTGTETVRYGSTLMIAFGVISCSVLMLYVFCRLGEIIHQEYVFLVCILATGMYFIVTYPFPFNSIPIAPYNETTHAGCNPDEYSWCEETKATHPLLFMISTVIIFAPCLPMMGTALDTTYSRVLGNIDQNIAHGLMTIVDDVIFMITPIFTTSIFTMVGVGPLWLVIAALFFVMAALWAYNLRDLSKVE
ncbi:Protein CBG19165 [Caenorhabditis briggsae]|uniref:Protein CBG19165 n=1 Tax=Caenorhabditis briggsae TaxID=6238 RepID=A8XUZ5_CAEBR|nr:Protein CBG19165 [Caenorhabditis briggsae]CAP36462.2 Protein CBG19165 [Caenorhabditis briggsae]